MIPRKTLPEMAAHEDAKERKGFTLSFSPSRLFIRLQRRGQVGPCF